MKCSFGVSWLVILMLSSASTCVIAQMDTKITDNTLAVQYDRDIAPSRSPAFMLVDVASANILRPSSTKELVAAFSGFTESQAFGVEFSPIFLVQGPRLTLKDYRDNVLNRLQISLSASGAGNDTTGEDFALGMRFPFIDKTDLRLDDNYIKKLTQATDAVIQRHIDLVDKGKQDDGLTVNNALAEEAWNNEQFELSLAIKGHARDSKGRNIRVSKFGGWLTYGCEIAKNWRLLAGLNEFIERDPSASGFSPSGAFGVRVDGGVNWVTVSLELSANDGEGKSFQSTADLGLDISLGVEGLWMNMSAHGSYDYEMSKSSLQASAELKYNTISLWRMLSGK
jgi:hypothetical protein